MMLYQHITSMCHCVWLLCNIVDRSPGTLSAYTVSFARNALSFISALDYHSPFKSQEACPNSQPQTRFSCPLFLCHQMPCAHLSPGSYQILQWASYQLSPLSLTGGEGQVQDRNCDMVTVDSLMPQIASGPQQCWLDEWTPKQSHSPVLGLNLWFPRLTLRVFSLTNIYPRGRLRAVEAALMALPILTLARYLVTTVSMSLA